MPEKNIYRPTPVPRLLEVRELYSLHYFTYSRSFRFEGESHPFWEAVCCDGGEAEVTDGDNVFRLRRGQAVLHAPGVFHNVRPLLAGTSTIIFGFGGDLAAIERLAGTIQQLSAEAQRWMRAALRCGRNAFSPPLNRVYQYALEVRAGQEGALQQVRNALENFLLCLPDQEAVPVPETHGDTVRRIEEVLAASVGSKLTIGSLAERLGYSPTHLKKLYREGTGTTIIRRFIALKTERAKELIAEGGHTFAEIAGLLGYDTPQYFSKQFREVTGMTPSAYARSVTETGIIG